MFETYDYCSLIRIVIISLMLEIFPWGGLEPALESSTDFITLVYVSIVALGQADTLRNASWHKKISSSPSSQAQSNILIS